MRNPKLATGIYTTYNHVGVNGCLLRRGDLQVMLRGDRFVFSGGPFGEHSLDADESITSAARLVAHWSGYVANASEVA